MRPITKVRARQLNVRLQEPRIQPDGFVERGDGVAVFHPRRVNATEHDLRASRLAAAQPRRRLSTAASASSILPS